MDILIIKMHNNNYQGYVGVPPGHPLHGKDYIDQLPGNVVDQDIIYTEEQLIQNKGILIYFLNIIEEDSNIPNSIVYQFNAPGGITFSGYKIDGKTVKEDDEEKRYWYFGWDAFTSPPNSVSEEEALEHTKNLKQQIEIWTTKYYEV